MALMDYLSKDLILTLLLTLIVNQTHVQSLGVYAGERWSLLHGLNQLKSALLHVHSDDLTLSPATTSIPGGELSSDDFTFLNYQASDIKSHRKIYQTDFVPMNPNQHSYYFQQNSSASLLPFLTTGGEFSVDLCRSIPVFVRQQKKMCENYLELIPSAIRGYSLGISECESQFLGERWNCRGHNHTVSLHPTPRNTRVARLAPRRIYRTYMDRLIGQSNKEAGFMLAITSAGVVHSVTKMCATGRLSKCGCDASSQAGDVDQVNQWQGCSENVHFGEAFAREFLDPKLYVRMRRFPASTVTNLHNSLVGRKAVFYRMTNKCTCHGTSGSCHMKACFRALPDFRVIGKALSEMYGVAKKVEANGRKLLVTYEQPRADYFFERIARGSQFQGYRRNMRTVYTKKQEPPSDSQLVYLKESPSYCNHHPNIGSLGTTGRVCQINDQGPSHCNELCCGRGYVEEHYRIERKCHCKFQWCCKVECQICEETIKIYRCR